MAKYYILYNQNKITHFLPFFPNSFLDISEIDSETINFTKDDLINQTKIYYPSIDLAKKELFIAKVTLNKKNHMYNIDFYEPLFQSTNLHLQRLLYQFQKLACQRLKKITDKSQSIKLTPNNDFQVFMKNLINEIISNHQLQLFMTQKKNRLNPKLKQALIQISTYSEYNLWQATIEDFLTSYPTTRNVLYEYLRYYKEVPNISKEENHERKECLFPSYIFDYAYDFNTLLTDVNTDYSKKFVPKIQPEDEKGAMEAALLHAAKTSNFSNPQCEELYRDGGIEAVMAMDGNDLYSLPDADLLKLGLISDEMYLQRKCANQKIS